MSARDRTAVLAMLENAQWVYSLGRYRRKQVLDEPVDVRMLRERIAAMRKAAGELSAAQKKKIEIPWARLEEDPDETPEMLWAVTKKVTPKLIAEMRPLVSDSPEAAFLISPEKKRAAKKTAAKKKTPVRKPKRSRR